MTTQARATELPPDVLEYLHSQPTLTLSTASPAGQPHAATFVYVNEGMAIYFATLPDTRTTNYIDQNPSVSFTIDHYDPHWRRIKGIQATGECQILSGPDDIGRVDELFQRKFPSLPRQLPANRSVFRISPSEVYFINNEALTDDRQDLTSYGRNLVFSVFRDLPVNPPESAEAKLESMHIDAGQIIVRQGEPADRFFIVVEGEVEVVQQEGEQTRTLGLLRAGEFFGEIAVLQETTRTATVKALTSTTLMAMNREAFRGLVTQALGTSNDFGAVIQRRLDRSQQVSEGA